jgi:EAL domain-containing protein (putative c-di-GMP-specific phosphodiesterase class I)
MSNVISLAHAPGLLAIVEGIESDGQLTSLREAGCDEPQALLRAPPGAARAD